MTNEQNTAFKQINEATDDRLRALRKQRDAGEISDFEYSMSLTGIELSRLYQIANLDPCYKGATR